MILQTTGGKGLLYKLLERAIIESHRENDYLFNVLNTKKIKQEYRDAIKKSYDIQEVDENDILICFEEKNPSGDAAQPTEEPAAPVDNQETTTEEPEATDGDKADDKPADDANEPVEEPKDEPEEKPEEKPPEDQEKGAEQEETTADDDSDDDEDDEDEIKKAVQEALMEDDDDTADEPEKLDDATPAENKDAEEGTTASSSANRETLIKAVARALYIENKDDVETFDVDFNGKKTFFIKVKIRK